MAQWVEPGHAMQLATEGMVLRVIERAAGKVTVEVSHDLGVVLAEPFVELAEGGFRIDLEVAQPAAVPV